MNQEQIQAAYSKYHGIVRKHLIDGEKMDNFKYYLKTKFQFMEKDIEELVDDKYTKGNKLVFTSNPHDLLQLESGQIPELKIAYFDVMCAKAAEFGYNLFYTLTETLVEDKKQIELQWQIS